MSNCSSDTLSTRLLEAIARECCGMAEDIAWLGGQVSGGTADSAALQMFDFLAQQAHAHALLAVHVARTKEGPSALGDMADVIGRIPLPEVRARLLAALYGEAPAAVNDDDTVLWMDG